MQFNNVDINPFWQLAQTYSICDAAALIAGYEPKTVLYVDEHCYFNDEKDRYGQKYTQDIEVIFKALKCAILDGILPATIRRNARIAGYDEQPNIDEQSRIINKFDEIKNKNDIDLLPLEIFPEIKKPTVIFNKIPDWDKTTITKKDLIIWLQTTRLEPEFFFPRQEIGTVGYLNPNHPRYSKKLAAAVNAWVSYQSIPGRTPKYVLAKWLSEHAREYGLTDDDHNPRKDLIDKLAAIPNWDLSGGVRTPGGE